MTTATSIYQQNESKRELLEAQMQKYINLQYQIDAAMDAQRTILEDAFEEQGGSELMKKGDFSGQFKTAIMELLDGKATKAIEKAEEARDVADLVRDKLDF